MARSWASYEEVTPIDTGDGHDYGNEEGDYENGDDRRRSSGGRSRRCKQICVCLLTLLAVAGVLVGTYFILDHYKMLPASLQFTNKAQPPTPTPVTTLPPDLNDTTTNLTNEEKNTNATNATNVPLPEGDLSSVCSKAYIDNSSDLDCRNICAAGECCDETAADSCKDDNRERCQLYTPCEILTQSNGTDSTQSITNTSVPTISPPDTSIGDITSLCSQEYLDLSKIECEKICSPALCCLPSAENSCLADNQDICELYSPCMNLMQGSEGNSTKDIADNLPAGTSMEASGMESNGTYYCGLQLPGGGSSAVTCSNVTCTTDSDCKGDQNYPACLSVCPQIVTGSESANEVGGTFNQSDATDGSEYPLGMPAIEEFNNTLPTAYSYCGKESGSGSNGQPICSSRTCTSNLDCSGNRSFPFCLKQCGPLIISENGIGGSGSSGMNDYGNGMGIALPANMSGIDIGSGDGDMGAYGSGSGYPGMPGIMLPPEGFQEALPTGYYYCGKNSTSSSVSQPACSSTNCTSDDDCSRNRTFPVCIKTCGPSIVTIIASNSTNSSHSGNHKQRHPAN
jgi:hypothetical protein